ncbi:hypothetical protein [Altererythrobacter sp. Root672]|uniref:hypothetical protein n=1 Tax=Altererythrobacter sp. Root672 TaxID=1736584 RepID=UPI0006FB3830|nr:hypothetical protein [Altererythrobacter sp. Root672]KRA81185.1 hypothetical protein ASD76_11400 [Altererythrobacter sp. Root672]
MNLRFTDWIWHVKGSLALAPGQSSDEAFDRLDPLFRETGTSHHRNGDTLTFRKKDQAAQDKMSIFTDGVLQIERGVSGLVLRYHLTSRALLLCFLAPLLFLGFAQLTIAIGILDKPTAQELAEEKKKEEEEEKKIAARPLNPIDKFLGAPAPEKPKKDKDKDKKKKDEEEDHGPSPVPAYVFAGIFAALYVGGRILEDRLVKSLFRKRLLGS